MGVGGGQCLTIKSRRRRGRKGGGGGGGRTEQKLWFSSIQENRKHTYICRSHQKCHESHCVNAHTFNNHNSLNWIRSELRKYSLFLTDLLSFLLTLPPLKQMSHMYHHRDWCEMWKAQLTNRVLCQAKFERFWFNNRRKAWTLSLQRLLRNASE